MDRRTLLGAGVTVAAGLAGCADDGSGGADDGSSGGDGSNGDDADTVRYEDLRIADHRLDEDGGETDGDVAVVGTLENTADETYEGVSITVTAFHPDGHQIDVAETYRPAVEGGEEVAVEVRIDGEAADVDDYEVEIAA